MQMLARSAFRTIPRQRELYATRQYPTSICFLLEKSKNGIKKRSLASTNNISSASSIPDLDHCVVHQRGDLPYGSREYILLPPGISLKNAEDDKSEKIACLRAHRNILFGAESLSSYVPNNKVSQVCLPLISAALEDASSQGEQPQALSTLHGLCAWVRRACTLLEAGKETSESLSKVLATIRQDDSVAFEAVKAIATGIPRPGHSVVGAGTYRDASEAWERLAKEFVVSGSKDLNVNNEYRLYQNAGAELVGIELLANTNPDYLESAGGSMARFFFI